MKVGYLVAALAAFAKASEVVVLTKENYAGFVKDEKLTLIEFYAPWCGHCKALAPEYDTAAEKLKEKKIKIAKVDCTVEADICSELNVQGYPTLKIFREGSHSDYKGQRTADSIVSTMIKQSLPALSEVKKADVEKFSKANKIVIMGYFKDNKSDNYKAFSGVANKYRDDYVFGFTTEGVTSASVTLFKQFDEGKVTYTGSLTSESELVAFVKDNSVPLMDEIGPENYSTYVTRKLPIVYLFYGNADDRKTYGAIVEPFAKTYKGKLLFCYIDAVKYGGHGKTLNLAETWPALAIQEPEKSTKYPFDQKKKISTEELTKFFKKFVAGELKPSLKSEKEPEKNDGPVKVVVGTNYEKIVMDKTKDVLLELYAPWCGHCKKLAPIYEELGTHLKGSKVVVAKMDGTENDLPAGTTYQVEGFPTIKLFKANDNTIVDFDGDRTLSGFVAFLKQHTVHKDTFKAVDQEAVAEEDEEDGHEEL